MSNQLDLDHFRARVLQDALSEGLAATWNRRADLIEWARPTADDYPGRATDEQRRTDWRRLTEQAEACRHHAGIVTVADFEELYASVVEHDDREEVA